MAVGFLFEATRCTTASRMPALQGLAKGLGELLNGALVALIPSPMALLLRFDQAGLLQDTHVMRDGGLREVDAVFDIACAKTDVLADRTGTANFENLQDAAAGRVGDRKQQTIESLVLGTHAVGIDGKLMGVNVVITG